jgi:hypothetical protein
MKKKPKPKLMTPAQQRDHLTVLYGTDANYVSARVAVTYYEMTKLFGKPCEEDERGCACCDAWHEWNTTGRATVLMNRDTLMEHLIHGDL